MRHEHVIRIYRKLSAKYEREGNEASTRFEASPWDEVYEIAADDSAEYWADHFTEIAQMVKVDNKVLKKELGTDALISGGAGQGSAGRDDEEDGYRPKRGRGYDPAPRGAPPHKRTRKGGGQRFHEVDDCGHHQVNRQGFSLCDGFQEGKCASQKGSVRCPANAAKVHQCRKCLDATHGAYRCHMRDGDLPQVPAAILRQQQYPRGRGGRGNRGGGGGGRGGYRGGRG